MEIKRVLLLISLSLFVFDNCQAGKHKRSYEESCCSSSLRKLSEIFNCLFENCLKDSIQYHYKKISYYDKNTNIEEFARSESQPLSILPNEVLYKIAAFLSPPNIISLIKSNKQFDCLSEKYFWVYYNQENKYSSWNSDLPAIKVAFSYYWFENNKGGEAASMGLPIAQAFLKQQEKFKQETWQQKYIPLYSVERSRKDFFSYKLRLYR